MPIAARKLLLPSLALILALPAICQEVAPVDAYGPWEVRRGRTTDAEEAGGFPSWTVSFSGPEETPSVAIAGDEDGKARGSILIGRRVQVTADSLPGLDFSYTTYCAMDNRAGRVELCLLGREAWDELESAPDTEMVFDSRATSACHVVSEHTGQDVTEPVALGELNLRAFSAQTRRFIGREVVLAVVWTALHSLTEHAAIHDLRLTSMTPADTAGLLFDRLDLARPDLAAVKAAWEEEDLEGAAAALAEHFRTRTEPRLPGDPRQRTPQTVSAAVRGEANAALENRFSGQPKYGLQKVPDPIDWSFNPTADPEWTWQFNRHSAWRALGTTYLATGEERYAEKWVALLRHWVAENPPGTRWSWRTIEAGIRGQGWPAVYFSFVDSPSFTPMDHVTFLGSLADHAEYLLPQGRFSSGSNWGQIESMGLLQIGAFFPEFKEAGEWRDTAWERIEQEMFRQVLEDGAQVELTTSYHQGVLSGFVRAAEIAALGGAEPTEDYWRRLERMYEYTMFLQKPDGTQPMLGDSWPADTSGTVASGGRRFSRPDMLYVGTRGKEGSPPEYLDTALPRAGYYVMRTDWLDRQAVYLLTDIAHRWGGGHQQPDALQINLYAYGKTLLPDSGSYLYYGPERAAFARTSSHSTITVDDSNQNTSAARLNCRFTSEALSFVDGSHDGYPGVTHRRQVLFPRPDGQAPPYFIIIDRLTGEGSHGLDQYFHFLPAALALDHELFEAKTALPEGPNLLVRALRTEGLGMEQVDSRVSFVYTEKEPRPAVRYRLQGPLPATFVTLLCPYPGSEAPAISAREVPMPGAPGFVAVQVTGPWGTDTVYCGEGPSAVQFAGVSATSRAGLIRSGDGGAPGAVTVVP